MLAREYERATTTKLQRHHLKDRWHSQVLVLCGADGYHLVPSVESFSRISGVCQILGDKHSASRPPQGTSRSKDRPGGTQAGEGMCMLWR